VFWVLFLNVKRCGKVILKIRKERVEVRLFLDCLHDCCEVFPSPNGECDGRFGVLLLTRLVCRSLHSSR